MPKASKNIKEDLNKNIPHTLPAIVNTVISVIFIMVVTVLRIMRPKDFSIGLYICFLVVLILFPISSWYTSYFSKKQKIIVPNNIINKMQWKNQKHSNLGSEIYKNLFKLPVDRLRET